MRASVMSARASSSVCAHAGIHSCLRVKESLLDSGDEGPPSGLRVCAKRDLETLARPRRSLERRLLACRLPDLNCFWGVLGKLGPAEPALALVSVHVLG